MNKINDSIDQRISAFLDRKAKEFPEINLQKSIDERPKSKSFVASAISAIVTGGW